MTTKEMILTSANKLFLLKGYDKTSVQNIIDEVKIAKGTFYHYFKSKSELLDELVTNLVKKESKKIHEIVKSYDGNAIDKLNYFFSLQSKWKKDKVHFLMEVLKVLYSDENLLFLKKLNEKSMIYYEPIISDIIKEGVNEKLFNVSYLEDIGYMLIKISYSFSDTLSNIFLNITKYDNPYKEIERNIKLYEYTFERLLGCKKGTIRMIDKNVIEEIIEQIKKKG